MRSPLPRFGALPGPPHPHYHLCAYRREDVERLDWNLHADEGWRTWTPPPNGHVLPYSEPVPSGADP